MSFLRTLFLTRHSCIHVLVFPAILFSCLIGCSVAPDVVWTPDSESIIYCKDDGAVEQYNVEQEAKRTLEGPRNHPVNVAVSPDGNFVATSGAAKGEGASAVMVSVYSLSTGTLMFSKKQVWGSPDVSREIVKSSSFWCPSGRRILVCFGGPFDKIEAVVFDISKKKFQRLTGRPPAEPYCRFAGVSPIRPDGAGYLAMKQLDNGGNLDIFSFVDWEGWEHEIETSDELEVIIRKMATAKDKSKAEQQKLFLPIADAKWEDNTVVLPFQGGEIRIDTHRKMATFNKSENTSTERQQLAAEGVISTANFSDGKYAIHCVISGDDWDFEVVHSAQKRRRVLIEGTSGCGAAPLVRSPDGKFIVAHYSLNGKRKISIIGNDGTLLATLDASKD